MEFTELLSQEPSPEINELDIRSFMCRCHGFESRRAIYSTRFYNRFNPSCRSDWASKDVNNQTSFLYDTDLCDMHTYAEFEWLIEALPLPVRIVKPLIQMQWDLKQVVRIIAANDNPIPPSAIMKVILRCQVPGPEFLDMSLNLGDELIAPKPWKAPDISEKYRCEQWSFGAHLFLLIFPIRLAVSCPLPITENLCHSIASVHIW